MAIESLPGQLPLFAEDDDQEADAFGLSAANADILRQVSELPDAVIRPLLFLSLVGLSAIDATGPAEAVEQSDTAEETAWRDGLLPRSWVKRNPAWM